jgi:hypothetical protein
MIFNRAALPGILHVGGRVNAHLRGQEGNDDARNLMLVLEKTAFSPEKFQQDRKT